MGKQDYNQRDFNGDSMQWILTLQFTIYDIAEDFEFAVGMCTEAFSAGNSIFVNYACEKTCGQYSHPLIKREVDSRRAPKFCMEGL